MRATALVLATALTGTAQAQTLDEAVRSNVALGVQLCAGTYQSDEAWLGAFRAAGFTETVEDLGNSEFNHHFRAPAGTAVVTVYLGHMAPDCAVTSTHLGVTGASALLDWLIPQIHPGKYGREATSGPTDPMTGRTALCVRYLETNAQLPEVISVGPAVGAQTCIENGTSRIYVATLV